MVIGADQTAVWSPYNHITVKEIVAAGGQKTVSAPAADIGALRDPPFYIVQVNQDFYTLSVTINRRRYTKDTDFVAALAEQYTLPHLIRPGGKDVLIMG